MDGDDGQVRLSPWSVDYAILDGGMASGRIVQITNNLPLRLLIQWQGNDSSGCLVYKKVLNGKYASRNDDGHVVYRYCEDQ